jgi:hypothetical protein
MAEDLARTVKFPWQIGTGGNGDSPALKGFFSMKLGTYNYLFPGGVIGQGATALFDTYEQNAKTFNRLLYPGGPSVVVKRTSKNVKRTRVSSTSTAKSERKLILSERGLLGASQTTIYYTGPTYGAVAWLKSFSNVIAGGGLQIDGPKGQSYAKVDAAIELPTV